MNAADLEVDTYSFYFMSEDCDPEREVAYHFHPDVFAPWTEPLSAFLEFLSQVYGYDIKKHVAVRANEYREVAWDGWLFDEETQLFREPVKFGLVENYGGSE